MMFQNKDTLTTIWRIDLVGRVGKQGDLGQIEQLT